MQSAPTCEARLESSPELYCLKKSAGSDMIRIIVAASMEIFSFVSIRAVIIFFTAEISRVLTETETEKNAIAISRRTLRESSTRSKSSFVIIGDIMPMSESARVASAIIT